MGNLISFAEASRRLNQPQSVMRRLMDRGVIAPDFVSGNHRYFKPGNLPRLEKVVSAAIAAEAPGVETVDPQTVPVC
jgi:hypothetical protein